VVTELRGEKIDVVPWSSNPGEFVANALQPAKVKEVRTDDSTQTALVIVPDYQLSLAIGKEGQNARLAARLTGWRIDIKSESQFSEEQRRPAVQAPAPEDAAEPSGDVSEQATAIAPDSAPEPSSAPVEVSDAGEAASSGAPPAGTQDASDVAATVETPELAEAEASEASKD
jgi:N utilization substance protein A